MTSIFIKSKFNKRVEGVREMKTMNWLHYIAYALLWVGGLNWGLVGLFNLNLVNSLFGSSPGLENLIYVLVGVSAVYTLATHRQHCKICSGEMKEGAKS